jgi:RNA polymerase sigma-70 factor (ECF subfamily)
MPEPLSKEKLDLLVAEGAAEWPRLHLDPAVFGAHLLAILERIELKDTREWKVGDLFLACCCIHDPSAISVFEQRFAPEIDSAAKLVDSSPAFRDEVKQRLNVILFVGEEGRPAKITQYEGTGPLGSWTRVAAHRIALRLRKQSNTRDVSDEPWLDALASDGDPLVALMRESYGSALRKALHDSLSSLPAGDRLLLRFHFLDEVSMERLGTMYRVHQATISRRLKRIRERLLGDAKVRLQQQLNISASECDSLVRLVQSSVDLSLLRVFDDSI